MAVTEGNLHVGGTSKSLDTTVVTQTDNATAHREVVTVGDPEELAAYAKVLNASNAPPGAYGVGTHVLNFPQTAFGELTVAENVPIYQTDFIYGGPHEQLHTETEQAGGAVSYSDGMVVCTSGATDLGLAAMSSKRFVKYRAGQGIMCRFTAIFDTPTASSIQAGGLSNGENGVLIGHRLSTDFMIWRQSGGARNVQTLTITTGSSHAENVTITLNGVAVTDVAVTNTADVEKTAWEIAQHDFTTVGDIGWDAYAEGDTVVFVCQQTGARAGAFSLSGATSAVGTFAETIAGAAPTVSSVTQANFNVDVLDGTGPSGITLDPTKGNVYQIDVQYLGFGSIRYFVEDPNTGRFQLFHIENNANAGTTPNMANPSLVWSLSAYNATGASVACKSASAALYTQGPRVDPIAKYGADIAKTGVGTGLKPVLSIKPAQVYGGALNLAEALIEEISVGVDGTKPFKVEVIVDGTLDNAADFAAQGGSSMMLVDTSATTITGGVKKLAYGINKDATLIITKETFGELFLNRNKMLTVAVDAGASNSDVDAGISWAEDV